MRQILVFSMQNQYTQKMRFLFYLFFFVRIFLKSKKKSCNVPYLEKKSKPILKLAFCVFSKQKFLFIETKNPSLNFFVEKFENFFSTWCIYCIPLVFSFSHSKQNVVFSVAHSKKFSLCYCYSLRNAFALFYASKKIITAKIQVTHVLSWKVMKSKEMGMTL